MTPEKMSLEELLRHYDEDKTVAAARQMARRLRAVSELHESHVGALDEPWCNECGKNWPCPTRRKLEGER